MIRSQGSLGADRLNAPRQVSEAVGHTLQRESQTRARWFAIACGAQIAVFLFILRYVHRRCCNTHRSLSADAPSTPSQTGQRTARQHVRLYVLRPVPSGPFPSAARQLPLRLSPRPLPLPRHALCVCTPRHDPERTVLDFWGVPPRGQGSVAPLGPAAPSETSSFFRFCRTNAHRSYLSASVLSPFFLCVPVEQWRWNLLLFRTARSRTRNSLKLRQRYCARKDDLVSRHLRMEVRAPPASASALGCGGSCSLAPSSLPPPNQFGRQRHTAGCCVLLRPLVSLRRQIWTVPTALTSRDPDISRLDLRRPLAHRLHVESSHQHHTALLYLCWSHAFAFGTRALHADVLQLISHPLSGRSPSFRLDRRALSGISADPPRRSAYEAAPPTPRPTDPPSTRPNFSRPRSSEALRSLFLPVTAQERLPPASSMSSSRAASPTQTLAHSQAADMNRKDSIASTSSAESPVVPAAEAPAAQVAAPEGPQHGGLKQDPSLILRGSKLRVLLSCSENRRTVTASLHKFPFAEPMHDLPHQNVDSMDPHRKVGRRVRINPPVDSSDRARPNDPRDCASSNRLRLQLVRQARMGLEFLHPHPDRLHPMVRPVPANLPGEMGHDRIRHHLRGRISHLRRVERRDAAHLGTRY